jgi:hypothetical protein
MELSLYSLCTDRRENSLPIVGTECLLNNCPATASYVVARTVESSPWQCCREVFTATLCSNQRGSARPGPAWHSEDTALTIHVTILLQNLIMCLNSEWNNLYVRSHYNEIILKAQKRCQTWGRGRQILS